MTGESHVAGNLPHESTTDAPGVVVSLFLAGELDMGSAPAVIANARRQLDSSSRSIIIDLDHVTFCDASGIRALLEICRAATGAGWQFQIVNPQPHIWRILQIAGMIDHLHITDADT